MTRDPAREPLARRLGDELVVVDGENAYALDAVKTAEYERADGPTRRQILARAGMVGVGAGVAMVGLPMAAAHASLITGNLVVSLNPTSGPDGQLVQVTVTNLPTASGTAITTVSFGATPVTPSNTTVTSGTANFTINVPNNLAPGTYTVTVHDNHNNQGTATFVIPTPSVTLSGTTGFTKHTGSGSGSNTITVGSSSGFLPGSVVSATASGPVVVTFTNTATVNSSGQIPSGTTFNFTYGNGTGTDTITFKDTAGNTATATISFA